MLIKRPVWVPLIFAVLLAGCGEDSLDYFPLEAGRFWQYDVTIIDMDLTRKSKYLFQQFAPVEMDGKRIYPRNMQNRSLYYYQIRDGGIWRTGARRIVDDQVEIDEENLLVMTHPPEVGQTWQRESVTRSLEVVIAPFRRHYRMEVPVPMTYRVESLSESVKVPAGHFTDCLKIVGRGETRAEDNKDIGVVDIEVVDTEWYAPGTGLVKAVRTETTSSNILKRGDFIMELEKY